MKEKEWLIKRFYIAENNVTAKNRKEATKKFESAVHDTEYTLIKTTVKKAKK